MLELNNVSKRIKNKTVINNVSFKFEEGTVYGLHGVNGSGKTMLLRMMSGLIVPNEGNVLWNGLKLHEDISFPGNVGIVIENMELLPQYSAFDNLKLLASIKKKAGETEIMRSLERVGLGYAKDDKVKSYSLGMKQRLNIAQAIFEEQELILLDEPTNALDESGVQQIHNVIQQEKSRGAIIAIATHHESDLKSMCDVILRIDQGRIIC